MTMSGNSRVYDMVSGVIHNCDINNFDQVTTLNCEVECSKSDSIKFHEEGNNETN